MPLPNITEFDAQLIETCDTVLGDTISYKPAGGFWSSITGPIVDYGEAVRDIGTGRLIDQDITITVSKRLIADRPTQDARVKLPALPGLQWKPINPEDLGTDWRFGVQRV